MTRSVWFPIRRIGPYHHARFEAASAQLQLTVIETRPASREYPWDAVPQGAYKVVRLPVAADPETDLPSACLDQELHGLLDSQGKPDVLVSMGWADRPSRRLLRLARSLQLPLLLVSDSRREDQPRRWPQELIKAILLRQPSAALVAGSQSRAYLEGLGFPQQSIFQSWDVVDNELFARPADISMPAEQLRHFLCVSRLLAKKNHLGLLQAYHRYQSHGGQWGLHLMGSGPEEGRIRAAILALPYPERVRLQPFQQLERVRRAYHEASAFVLASHTDQWGLVVNEAIAAGCPVLVSSGCGCSPDLIEHGLTGWSFQADQPDTLAALMHEVETLGPEALLKVSAAARAGLEHYGLHSFAGGLARAVEHALQQSCTSLSASLVASLLD